MDKGIFEKSGMKTIQNPFIRGKYKNMVWVQFQSEKERDEIIKKLPKPNCKMASTKIWVDKDLPYKERQFVAFLSGIRKNCIDRKLDKEALYVDEDTFSLHYDNDILGYQCLRRNCNGSSAKIGHPIYMKVTLQN